MQHNKGFRKVYINWKNDTIQKEDAQAEAAWYTRVYQLEKRYYTERKDCATIYSGKLYIKWKKDIKWQEKIMQ